jgi:fatty-acyl-CoA synthase
MTRRPEHEVLMTQDATGWELAAAAGRSTIDSLFDSRVAVHPDRPALESGDRVVTYRELQQRSRALAGVLHAAGVRRGARIALLSENRAEYLEVMLAAARLGAIVALQNRQARSSELVTALDLVEPELVVSSAELAAAHAAVLAPRTVIEFGPAYEAALVAAPSRATSDAEPEDVLAIVYTSGSTGVPKGACISHRALVARALVVRSEYGLRPDEAFVAWSPLSHTGALDNSLATLLYGGSVVVVDGFDAGRLADLVAGRRLGWLLIMPGTVTRLAAAVREKGAPPAGVRICGVMPDLVAPAEIAEITRLLDAPFANTFGATETGNPPASAAVIPVGAEPESMPKEQSAYTEIRLLGPNEEDVADGEVGEMCVRGPTVFSGYWANEEATALAMRGGWYHMGDAFRRLPNGTLDFVDRIKYMIKSGGENVYPAEVERVLLQQDGVLEAAVVRRKDPTWGEVPVAFVAATSDGVTPDVLRELCRSELARYKVPKEIHLVPLEFMPRNATGKVSRPELERLATERWEADLDEATAS